MKHPYLKLIHPLPGNVFPSVLPPEGNQQLALQYQLEKSQWMDPDDLFALTAKQLRTVISHAVTHVPYYRETFKTKGIRVPKEITGDWLASLPILERKDVQEHAGPLVARTFPREHGRTYSVTTSGSTGRAVTVTSTDYSQLLWRAFALREHIWHERDFRQALAGIRWLARGEAEFPQGGRSPDWGITASFVASGPGLFLNVATKLKDQIAWLTRNKPAYLTSFPSNLTALAQHCIRNDTQFPFLREVRTVGETFTPEQRDLIRQAWKVKAVDVYSCEEFGSLAIQCPMADHYHVQAENIHLEIVNDEGKPCAAGEPGRVLITTLHNFAMPLIRYAIGDIAVWGEPCPCGRGLPVISRILGRTRNRLILPDGSNEHAFLGMHGNYSDLTGTAAKEYQFIQKSLEEVEVRLAMATPMSADREERFAEILQKNLGHPFKISFVYMDEIPTSPSGKFEMFISEVEAP